MHDDDPDDEDWYDNDADAESVPCPACGTPIYDDADHCPACGHWITEFDRNAAGTGSGASRTVRIIAVVMIVVFLVTLLLTGTMF